MLPVKHIPIKSFNEKIAYIHEDNTFLPVKSIKNLSKIEIQGGISPISALLEITSDDSIVSPKELGLNTEAFEALDLPEGASVAINFAPPLKSMSYIRKKIKGSVLTASEYKSIVEDITEGKYSNTDLASFLVAAGSFISYQEVLSLTQALIGDKTISWDESIIADHHCLGGIPGNKTDIIITAIVAAYGLPIPKTCSHSLSSAAGVADTMEVLANIELDEKELKKAIKENRGAIIDYESLGIAETNKQIASVERQIGLIQHEHLIASILAIKAAAGITHLLIDIPVGPKSRVKDTTEAMHLRKIIEHISDALSIYVDVVITDGQEPIGNGIGSVLEARDIMMILRNKEDAPSDLKEKSLFLAGKILEFDPNLRGGQGYLVAKEILEQGRAFEAMNKIINFQGKSPQPQLGQLTRDIISPSKGTISSIDNSQINKIAVLAGANKHQGAGLDLLKKVGDKVEKGETIYRVHSINSSDFAYANAMIDTSTGYEISTSSKSSDKKI